MMIISVIGETKMRVFNGADYTVEYTVKASSKGLYYSLTIDGEYIVSIDSEDKEALADLEEMRENTKQLVYAICNLMCVSTMGTNQNVFHIEIDPDTMNGHITRTGQEAMLEEYGIHPSQNLQ